MDFKLLQINKPNILTIEQFSKLPTKRMLTYYKKARSMDGWGVCQCCGESLSDTDSKLRSSVLEYRKQMKKLLDSRENV